jgi:transcriptional regulator with XRE-family HTH domain
MITTQAKNTVKTPLGQLLYKLRRSRRETARAMALRLGTHQPSIARYENGRHCPSPAFMDKLRRIYKIHELPHLQKEYNDLILWIENYEKTRFRNWDARNKSEFGKILVKIRLSANETQLDMANKLFVCDTTLSSVECGRREFEVKFALRLIEVYNPPVETKNRIHELISERCNEKVKKLYTKYPDRNLEFAQYFLRYRTINGMSQGEAADTIGIHWVSYNAYETGRELPSVAILIKLTTVFSFSPEELEKLKFLITSEDGMLAIGRLCQKLRKKTGDTIAMMGGKLNLDATQLRYIEMGNTVASTQLIESIATAYNMDVEDIYSWMRKRTA